ncbi:MAG: MFS transporter [Anaerolineae bacterium]|jgi:FSR family fosmidomycin resistance protein-like MFS transporter|nr:MFS transporter [Anaerolineae bacterium]MBT4311320.1 MFS transporter [Anaerolineae bacterium]MBT4459671.1 MFS transporter [Anaerolineae bacterium]MBT4841559.1 MFS transporter [Anaerolineae bacterium]MBT6063010.1 MFS transporter [Anaerolineae bacterium]
MPQNLDVQPHEESGFQSGEVFLIASGHFIHDVYSAFLAPLLPLLRDRLSLSLTMAGSLSAFMQFPALLNPLIGRLADKSKARYFVVFAPAITATLMSVMGLAPNYYALLTLLIVAGISVASFHSPAPAMIARVAGKRVGKAMGWFMAGGELGRTLGPIIAVWAATTWTLEGMWRIMVLGWVTSVILFFRLEEIPIERRKTGSIRKILPKLKAVFLPLTIILLFRTFMAVSMTTYLPLFMNMKGASIWLAGASLSIMESAGVVGALSVGAISDRVGRKSVFLFSAALSPLLVIAFLNSSGWLLVPILLAIGFTVLSIGPVFLALIQDHFPENRATANGAYMFLAFLTRFPATILVGILGDKFGLETAFLWSALLAFLVVPSIFLLPPEPKSELA